MKTVSHELAVRRMPLTAVPALLPLIRAAAARHLQGDRRGGRLPGPGQLAGAAHLLRHLDVLQSAGGVPDWLPSLRERRQGIRLHAGARR